MNEATRQGKVVELLSEALALEGPQRQSFLDQRCGQDLELRQELEALLDEESSLDEGFLAVPAAAAFSVEPTPSILTDSTSAQAPTGSSEASPSLPDRLGAYRIIAPLGQGGMGTVYLAEQEEPIRRRVAIKVLDAIHSAEHRQRFTTEGQTLAHLNHPNIASLYEVGSTKDGHLFVVMELLHGTTITDWCDDHQLPLRQRLELFLGVCAGVQHAHEKGILHRDLKPLNILVVELDQRPVAKVIDFGVARAFDGETVLPGSRLTRERQLIGSPAYMSPEAALHGTRKVDTRSDIYALGVVLYELLIGVHPFPSEESLGNLLRRLAEDVIQPPSERLGQLGPAEQEVLAASRALTAKALRRHLRGDLDAIVLKALARDREQRYSSPTELATDLERYLKHELVSARQPTSTYLLGRFLRRRSGVVASVILLMAALAVGIVTRSLEARRATAALAEAQEVSRFMVELFELADPERLPNDPVDLRQLLARGAARLETELTTQPLTRARLLQTIGDIYTKLALFEPAEKLIAEALEIRQKELPADDPDVLSSVNQLGVIYRRQGRLDEAEPLLRRVLESRQRASEPDPVQIALALNNLGNLLWSQQRLDEAEALHRQALEIRQRELAANHSDLADTLNNLGVLLLTQRRFDEAAPFVRRAVLIHEDGLGDAHPRLAASLNNLGEVEMSIGEWEEAELHFRRALGIWQAAYDDIHPRTRMARRNLVGLLTLQGRFDESLRLMQDLLDLQRETLPSEDPKLASTLSRIGIAFGRQGLDFAAAEEAFSESFFIRNQALGSEHAATLTARANQAWLAWRQGRLTEAEAVYRQVLADRQRILGSDHVATAWTLHHLALTVADLGRDDEAETLLEQAAAIREEALGTSRELAETLLALGELHDRNGRQEKARQLLRRAVDLYEKITPPDFDDRRRAVDALAAIETPTSHP